MTWTHTKRKKAKNSSNADFLDLMARWRSVFSSEQIQLHVYEKAVADSSIEEHFLGVLGISVESYKSFTCGYQNSSPSDLAVKSMLRVNRFTGFLSEESRRYGWPRRVRRWLSRSNVVSIWACKLISFGNSERLSPSFVGEVLSADFVAHHESFIESYVDAADKELLTL